MKYFFIIILALLITASVKAYEFYFEPNLGKVYNATSKGAEMAKVGKVKEKRVKYEIEILDINQIDGGVEVFARAWDENGAIGFGDGTVEIERFLIINPPILVEDESGDIVREYESLGKMKTRRLREDPREALMQILEQTIDLKTQKFSGEKIEKGKIGRSTLTTYPAAGANSPADGGLYKEDNADWDTVHDATDAQGVGASSAEITFAGAQYDTNYYIDRGAYMFNTSSIPVGATITSAVLSLWAIAPLDNNDNDGNDFVVVVQLQNGWASAANVQVEDFDQVGAVNTPTEGSGRIDLGAMSIGQYTNFTGDADMISWIAQEAQTKPTGAPAAGITYLGTREGHDVLDSAISAGGWNRMYGYAADQTGTTNDPKLTIEYSTSSSRGGDIIIF